VINETASIKNILSNQNQTLLNDIIISNFVLHNVPCRIVHAIAGVFIPIEHLVFFLYIAIDIEYNNIVEKIVD